MKRTQKIEWLSILQGWSMLLVVLGHITLTNTFNDPQYPTATLIEKIIYSFHMPLFIFISGYLFYSTKLKKGIKYQLVIKDKAIRLGIPFLFFTILTLIPKIVFAPLMKRPIPMDWNYLIDVFILFKTNPLLEMWFIITLFILMLLYPIYKLMLKQSITIIGGIIVFTIIHLFNPHNIDLFQLSNVMKMGIFFWLGILFAHFNLIRFICKDFFLVIAALFILSNILNTPLIIKNITGILFSLSFSVFISKYTSNIFSSFRDFTYQIYLMGIFFQMIIRYLFTSINHDFFYLPCYLISIIMGLYGPVLIIKCVQKIDNKYLNLCFGMK